jgi:hypothetical protein
MNPAQQDTRRIFQLAFVFSLLISVYTIWQDDTINDNGYIYLQAAQFFLDSGISAAYAISSMPFFSIVTAVISAATGLSLEHAVYVLNSFLFAIMAVAFGKIVVELTTDRRVLLIALTLLLAHPKINDNYRASILRDPGYWAFYLLAVLYYLRFWKDARWQDASGWGVTIILATLFRYEGIVFILCAPLFLFLKSNNSGTTKIQQFFRLNSIPLTLLTLALIVGITTDKYYLYNSTQWTNLTTWISEVIPNLYNLFLDRADRLSSAIFNEYPYSRGYSLAGVIITLLVIFITETSSSLTHIYTPFALHSAARHIFPRRTGISAIVVFIAINTAIILIYLSRHLFVTGRYVIPLILLLLLFAAFSLSRTYEIWNSKKHFSRGWRWAGRFALTIFVLASLDGFISTSPSKVYVREAGYWLQENKPSDSKVYTNVSSVLYYSGNIRDDLRQYAVTIDNIDQLLDGSIKDGFVAFNIRRKDKKLNQWLSDWKGAPPIKEFKNSNGDKMVIFATTSQ